jgi:hypothetical protein
VRQAGALAIVVLFAACGSDRSSAPTHVVLGGDVVARVSETAIPAQLVARVASARGVSPRDATTLLIDDALAAQGAMVRGLNRMPSVSLATTSALARNTTTRARDAAHAAGPPSEAEIAELRALHWKEVALPEQVKVMHAIVLRPKQSSPDKDARGRAVAAEIAKALAGVTDEQLEPTAKAVEHQGFEVKVERLPAFIASGRTAEGPDESMTQAFAAAAFALPSPGATSGVVATSFGWHVIRLLERRPAHELRTDELRMAFAEEVYAKRARAILDAIVTKGRARVEVSTAAESLMAEAMAAVQP